MYQLRREGTVPLMRQREEEGMEYLTFPALEACGMVDHLFTTRVGGASQGYFAQSNFSFALGDERSAVEENYRRISRILGHGGSLEDFVLGQQTHTTNVRVVTEADRGKGVTRPLDYQDVDGLVTDVPGLILGTFHADCTPLYLVDPVHRAIGLSHSGWKGTVHEMGRHTLEVMREHYGTDPADVLAAIGPSICQDCYEVGEEVAEAFRRRFPAGELERYGVLRAGRVPGKVQLGLWAANRMILERAGVPAGQISVTDVCTRCNSDYLFSHRITGWKRGVMAAFLSIREG